MIYRTDANGLVIGLEAESDDEVEEAGALRIRNADGVPTYKIVSGVLTPRTNTEIMQDTPMDYDDLFPADDIEGDEPVPMADRVEALEQALELILSGEVE